MDIVILGAGALGSVLGGLMARADIPVTLLDVNQAHIDAINATGLRLDLDGESDTWRIPAMRPEEYSGHADLIILLTKTMHTAVALQSVERLITAGAHVLTIQNGLGNADRVAEYVPHDHILEGSTMIPADLKGPGHASTHAGMATTFKSLTPRGRPFAEKLAELMEPVDFVLDDHADVVIWQKAAFNCALNTISALCGARVGDIANEPSAVVLAKAAADEVVDVANAKGIAAMMDAVHAKIDEALAHHKPHKASMLQDVEAGRPTEIEALCGMVEREAIAYDVHAPINKALAALIRLKESAAKAEW